MFRIVNLSKNFKDLKAVDQVSFSVQKGEIYGLLGPNGAGKSTIINMITGLLSPDNGTMEFNDSDCTHCPVSFRKKLGVSPQNIALYEELSAWDNLKFWGRIHGLPPQKLKKECQNVAEKVGLHDRLKDTVKNFSGGMKRRLNLAAALMHQPDLLLLDEPTAGVDPQSRHHIMEIVKNMAARGTAILYTTHYLEEAESLCDKIGIIDKGKIIAEGSLNELCESVQTGKYVSLEGEFETNTVRSVINLFQGTEILSEDAARVVVRIDNDEALIKFMKDVFNHSLKIQSVSIKPPSLETVFLILTGKELRD